MKQERREGWGGGRMKRSKERKKWRDRNEEEEGRIRRIARGASCWGGEE